MHYNEGLKKEIYLSLATLNSQENWLTFNFLFSQFLRFSSFDGEHLLHLLPLLLDLFQNLRRIVRPQAGFHQLVDQCVRPALHCKINYIWSKLSFNGVKLKTVPNWVTPTLPKLSKVNPVLYIRNIKIPRLCVKPNSLICIPIEPVRIAAK